MVGGTAFCSQERFQGIRLVPAGGSFWSCVLESHSTLVIPLLKVGIGMKTSLASADPAQ